MTVGSISRRDQANTLRMDFTTFLLYLVLRRSLLVLIFFGFIIFAFVRWKRHPSVSLMTVLALIVYIIESFVFAIVYHFLPDIAIRLHLTDRTFDVLGPVLNVVDALIFSLVLILLVIAAFSQRRPATVINP